MSPENLWGLFHVDDVDHTELEQVLLSHFSRARQTSPNEIVYSRSESGNGLTLIYDDDGVLIRIDPGDDITEGDIETLVSKIEQNLIQSSTRRVGRIPLFTSLQVKGYFQYNDIFQIAPVPPDSPRPRSSIGDHPFLLEFQFPDSPDFSIRLIRRAVKERELELLLAAILKPTIKGLGKINRSYWVLPTHDVKETWISGHFQEMYTFPGLKLEDTDSSPVDGVSNLPMIDPVEYYARRGISPDQGFDLPSNLINLLDCFFQLPISSRKRFLHAAFWFQHSSKVWIDSRSASYTALISAVESLMPREKKGFCKACNRTIEKRTQQFIDFVDAMAPEVAMEGDRKELYSTRSALSHGGKLLHSDYSTWGPTANPSGWNESQELGSIFNLVRYVMINWLLSTSQSDGRKARQSSITKP